MGLMDTWTCHVCGRERPDPAISVFSSTVLVHGIEVRQNVRYCADNPDCEARARTFSFFQGKEARG